MPLMTIAPHGSSLTPDGPAGPAGPLNGFANPEGVTRRQPPSGSRLPSVGMPMPGSWTPRVTLYLDRDARPPQSA